MEEHELVLTIWEDEEWETGDHTFTWELWTKDSDFHIADSGVGVEFDTADDAFEDFIARADRM